MNSTRRGGATLPGARRGIPALVVPDVSGLPNQEAAYRYLTAGLMPHPWVFRHGTKESARKDFSFSDESVLETYESIADWPPNWRCGLATCPVSRIIAADIDVPEEFKVWDFKEFPLTVCATTGRTDGYHLLFDARALSAEDWPKQGNIPGGQIKSNGFISVEPSRHPNGRQYRWKGKLRMLAPVGELGAALAEYRRQGKAPANDDAPAPDADELWGAVLAARDTFQHGAIFAWSSNAHDRSMSDREIVDILERAVDKGELRSWDRSDPWNRAGLWKAAIPDDGWEHTPNALLSEVAGINDVTAHREIVMDEEEFWDSRPVLSHIRASALARRAAPWATLGEAIAEAVCHTPPSFQLPPEIGGNGSLNMLIAIVGKPGAGKNAAAKVARQAFEWHGVLPVVPDMIPRLPLGSGEGLARNFGYTFKDKDTGRTELNRTDTSVIVEIAEIDTFAAIRDRSGSTLSPELRKLYSGEKLGFAYSDPQKRVIIPEHSYRSCVIAGVQPGRGQAILGDVDGGFPQRWLWLPAHDPSAPDVRPTMPPFMEWKPPGLIRDLDHSDGPYVMRVCATARRDIDEARVASLRGNGGDMESHAMYTRLKVAAGLALLDSRDEVEDSDWELSLVVMKVSDHTRQSVASHLRKRAHEANVERGKSEGVRREVAESTIQNRAQSRMERNALAKMPGDGSWTGFNAIRRYIQKRDREDLEMVLSSLVEKGALESRLHEYQGQTGTQYRKVRK